MISSTGDRLRWTEQARALAGELGFLAAGAAPLGPSAHAAALSRWLEAGWHGQMDWLARSAADRLDPARRFPWARSALVLAASYAPPAEPPGASPPTRIAAYARGRDYHKVLERRTRELGRRLAEHLPGLRWRAYTDTGPLIERELGALAGLGWIGKNAMLLSAEYGSYTLLAVLLLGVELEYGVPQADQCGGCQRCLDACPTGALVEPRRLDARRCLSYLTIEHRGELDPPDLAGYLFGCDLCQTACPYNAAAPQGDAELAPRDELEALDLAAIVALDAPRYQAVFRASAVKRAGLSGLRRNAMWLALQLGDAAALAATRHNVEDPDPTVAATARAVLERAGASYQEPA